MGIISRATRLATVPLGTGARMAGAATRVALGGDRTMLYDKATLASVDAAVATLARVRGPAMKFGQVISVFTSALPPELASRFAALERLYDAADPLPFADLEHLLEVVPSGRLTVDPTPAAAASLGQVHRGVWTCDDSSTVDVAVKLRYPDAPRSVKADMLQLRAIIPLVGRLLPGLDLKALLAEHTERLIEELDYRNEARWMRKFADAWSDEAIAIPDVVFVEESVLVSTWLDGQPLAALAADTSDDAQERRDAVGQLLVDFCFLSPGRLSAAHSDPHPGNFRLTPDGKLGVLDFGSVAQGAGAFTLLFASSARLGDQGRSEELRQLWLDMGMLSPSTTAEELVELLDCDPRTSTVPTVYATETFTFSTEWMVESSARWRDPSEAIGGVKKLRFPPAYLLEHRAVMGTLALLAQLRATVRMRDVLDRTLDGDSPAGAT